MHRAPGRKSGADEGRISGHPALVGLAAISLARVGRRRWRRGRDHPREKNIGFRAASLAQGKLRRRTWAVPRRVQPARSVINCNVYGISCAVRALRSACHSMAMRESSGNTMLGCARGAAPRNTGTTGKSASDSTASDGRNAKSDLRSPSPLRLVRFQWLSGAVC